ncbi:MAG: 30S ribosomal protein S6 [bacterium]|nr:30S ribosomal protein S6 [bacterium]
MNHYELTYLVASSVPEEEIRKIREKITAFSEEKGGLFQDQSFPLKKKLAYPIKKETEAYLCVATFQLNPEHIDGMEKILKEENRILRHLILTKKPSQIRVEKAEEFKIRFPLKRKEGTTEQSITRPQEKKVELEEIEKRLEEILNEPQ